jgi:uncharacterized LabA/DUF88 family protein
MLDKINLGRMGIFIDEANIYHSQKTLGWEVDYVKLRNYFSNIGDVSMLNFYTSFQNENKKQTDFLRKLQDYGYKIISKQLKIIKNNRGQLIKKGNLDTELALDAYRFKERYETLVLFSGDSDFAYLINLLKGRKIIIVSTRKHISKELLEISDYYLDLKRLTKDISFNQR